MKPINFITPVPAHTKKEVRRWLLASSALIGMVIIGIGVSVFSQWYLYRSLLSQRTQNYPNEAQYCPLVDTCKQKDALLTTQSRKLAKIRQYQKHPKNPIALLKACAQKVGSTALRSCNITPHAIELVYDSTSIALAQKKLLQLETIDALRNAQLICLQTHNNTVLSTVRAQGSKKKSRD